VTASALVAAVLAANPGPAVHLAALGVVVLVGLAIYGVVRWRRGREAAQAESESNARDTSSPRRSSETPRS
jgi:membrane protein implicated in regulation of membrane protease activity